MLLIALKVFLHTFHTAKYLNDQIVFLEVFTSLTLRPDGLGDGAGVTQAVRVDRSDNKEIDSVGEESDDRVPLVPHVVRHRLPSAAH